MLDWARPILRSRSATEFYLLFVAFVLPWQDHQIMRKGITFFHVINAILTCFGRSAAFPTVTLGWCVAA